MKQNEDILFEYKGNQFWMHEERSWYTHETTRYRVSGIAVAKERLCLPDSYQGCPVSGWSMEKEIVSFPNVKIIFLPASVIQADISNAAFPNLEKIELQAGHSEFSTDGKMLFSADGRKLLYSLAAGNCDRAVVPGTVKKIADTAFQNTSCSEIVFENPDVSADSHAFLESEWLKRQGDFCIVGNMFYKLNHPVDRLAVPKGIRRFHERAFSSEVPRHLITPVMPSRYNIEHLGGRYYSRVLCEELTFSSVSGAVNFEMLRSMEKLKAVHIVQGHRKYSSMDGVVFSSDKKCLEYYPQAREQKEYSIPDGTVKIARKAFAGQKYLNKIRMPASIQKIGMGAFYACKELREAVLSDNIKEIPDACAYQNCGVFEGCRELKEIVLPAKMRYVGQYAFYRSGLKKAVLNDGLKQVGEYAFAHCLLDQIALPASVERLGKGALLGIERVDAYIGTAKGLISAVNTVPSNMAEKNANVEWVRCMVCALHKRGREKEVFLIPGSLKRSAAYHLDMAWNSDQIDYEEYDACFEFITDTQERIEFAEMGILRLAQEEDTPYTVYMKHAAARIAMSLIENEKEKEFLTFLKRGYLSENALGKLLKAANEHHLTTCSAYILKYQDEKGGRKKKRLTI